MDAIQGSLAWQVNVVLLEKVFKPFHPVSWDEWEQS